MLELRDVGYYPDGITVLDGVSFSVKKGQIFVIMGTSGAGKSTILRLINGLIKPDRGEIFVDREEISGYNEKKLIEIRKKVGMVFQSAALFDSLTVAENVGFAWRKDRISQAEFRKRVADTLKVVGLEGIEDRMPSELSGGMKKRVGLARAIAMRPEVLLYDEPTSGLDPVTSNTILGLIKELRQKLGVTSVVVTHDMQGALAIADQVAILSQGKIAYVGTVEEIKNTSDKLVKSFINGLEVHESHLSEAR